MKRMTRSLALLLSLVMLFSLAACGSKDNQSETNSNPPGSTVTDNGGSGEGESSGGSAVILDNGRLEKFVIGMANDPQELAPWNPNNLGKNLVWHQIYECLFDIDGADYVPVLAKGYEKVDETTYDVEIYDYIQDSAGNPITADDVVYSYQVLIDSGFGIKYDIFDGIEKVGDYTVRFSFKEDPMVALGALEFVWGGTAIFSKAAYESGNFATAPVATGPYTVKEYQSGSKLVLEANDNYWQEDSLTRQTHKRNVQTIEYDIIAEAASQTVALTTGGIQYSNAFDTSSLFEFEEGGQYAADFTVNYAESNFVYFLMPNVYPGQLCADVNLRKAIFYAMDNVQLAAAVNGMKAASTMGTSIFADYDADWETAENYITQCDLEQAKQYLEQSNYNGETLRFAASNSETDKNIGTIVVALLGQLGIKVDFQTLDLNSLNTLELQNDGWDLMFINCASGGFSISLQQVVFDNTIYDDGLTLGNIDDPAFQDMYNLCNTVAGNTKENMKKMQEYWMENAYVDPLTIPVNTTIYSNVLVDVCYDNNWNFVPGGSTYAGQ